MKKTKNLLVNLLTFAKNYSIIYMVVKRESKEFSPLPKSKKARRECQNKCLM